MNAAELHEAQTQRFVDENSRLIELYRSVLSPDGAGGFTRSAPVKVNAQSLRVVGLRNARPITTPDGTQDIIEKNLVGMPGADIQIGDTFEHNGSMYEVLDVNTDPGWSVVAGVRKRG